MLFLDLWNPIEEAAVLILVGFTHSDLGEILSTRHLLGDQNELHFDVLLTDQTLISLSDTKSLRIEITKSDVDQMLHGKQVIQDYVNPNGAETTVILTGCSTEQALDNLLRQQLSRSGIEINSVQVIKDFQSLQPIVKTENTNESPATD